MWVDPLFNCQTCTVDNDCFSEINSDSVEVSIIPPTEAVEKISLFCTSSRRFQHRCLGCFTKVPRQWVSHTVAYVSRNLLDSETRYSTIKRVLLGVVSAIHRFKYYLLGANFLLEANHKPLVYLNLIKGDNDRLMQWALGLLSDNFQIVHIPGRDNVGADFLSWSITMSSSNNSFCSVSLVFHFRFSNQFSSFIKNRILRVGNTDNIFTCTDKKTLSVPVLLLIKKRTEGTDNVFMISVHRKDSWLWDFHISHQPTPMM